MTFDPDKQAMFCPHCEGTDCETVEPGNDSASCVNCGAPVEVGTYNSTAVCEHCGCHMIFESRIEGEYKPHLIMPFKIGKEKVKQIMISHFGKNLFLPGDFLGRAQLDKIQGIYVPFWMYDYDVKYDYKGVGKKVRKWTIGNTEYTETSIYDINRSIGIDFDMIPVDASVAMEDGVMDLMEPYVYSAIEEFECKYMSGFDAEVYNYTAEQMQVRALGKVNKYSEMIMAETITGYTSVQPTGKNIQPNLVAENYALLPVWLYRYNYNGKNYDFYINGQTGKVVGNPPISKAKKWGYSGIFAVIIMAILNFGWALLEIL